MSGVRRGENERRGELCTDIPIETHTGWNDPLPRTGRSRDRRGADPGPHGLGGRILQAEGGTVILTSSGHSGRGDEGDALVSTPSCQGRSSGEPLLSALPCSSSSLRSLEDTDIWKGYAAQTDSSWTDVNSKRFQSMRIWSETDLHGSFKDSNVLFYPFGGPDIITAFQLFADADTYILIGLEPVGNLPEVLKWKAPVMKQYFADMDSSLSYFYLKSYFITREMLEDLQNNRIDGVLPILCFFLERSGASILDIRRIEFDDAGKSIEIPYERQLKRSKRPYGVVIDTYSAASEKRRKVYYFSSDLADAAFNPGSKFYPFLDSFATMNVFVKSASYLLHYKEFSNIRNLILAKSRSILEDDTGIPYRFFKPDEWSVRLFGIYAKPVKDFRGVDQPDLEAAFRMNKPEQLPFDVGYHWKTDLSLLMLAQRK
jgi:hypothetical protein